MYLRTVLVLSKTLVCVARLHNDVRLKRAVCEIATVRRDGYY